VLRAVAVEKRYAAPGRPPVEALRGVTFDLGPGEFVALMGPSGCGKSTLLQLAGAMDRATAGRIEVGGEDLGALDDEALARVRRDRIGFVFQFFNLLPTLDVAENVGLPALLRGARPAEAREYAMALLARVGLAGRAGHTPAELSGGEMQRAAVARALVNRPDLLLADEPTGSLDSAAGSAVIDLLAEVNRDLGVTVVIATHSADVARSTRRCLRLLDGRLDYDGPPDGEAAPPGAEPARPA
jgi:putative ABC transport system ATP-binding protein